MDNNTRAALGRAATRAGTPDWVTNDDVTNAVDTIANILHAVNPANVGYVLEAALMHYDAEVNGE